jgi:hypothetical protein
MFWTTLKGSSWTVTSLDRIQFVLPLCSEHVKMTIVAERALLRFTSDLLKDIFLVECC